MKYSRMDAKCQQCRALISTIEAFSIEQEPPPPPDPCADLRAAKQSAEELVRSAQALLELTCTALEECEKQNPKP